MRKNKKVDFDPEKVANAEIGWWEAHHRKDYDEVISQMTLVYVHLFDLSHPVAREVVILRIEAAKEHDLAENENITIKESKQHWQKAKELMTKHFALLKDALLQAE